MTDSKAVKSKRDSHLERLRRKYPDRRFEDDEEIFAATGDDYDEYEKNIEGYRKNERALSALFDADPRSAQFLVDMHNGNDPVLGLVRNFGVEIKDVLDDPGMQDKIAEANREYVERVAQSKKLDEEYERNMDATLDTLRRFQEQRGMSDEQVDRVVEALIGIVRDGVMGKFSETTLDMVCKALDYEADVASAAQEGEVAGRNARIVEQHRRASRGDGLAPLDGKNGQGNRGGGNYNMFDLANEAM